MKRSAAHCCNKSPDNDVNITELVNALRDDSNKAQVELDFDIRHTSACNDSFNAKS